MFQELKSEFSGLSLSSKAIKLYLIRRYKKQLLIYLDIKKIICYLCRTKDIKMILNVLHHHHYNTCLTGELI